MKKTTKWILQATLGLLLTGAGLSMAIDAGLTKTKEAIGSCMGLAR